MTARNNMDSDKINPLVQTDYENARATLLQLLEEGKEAVSLGMEIARSTEHPRAIEVVSGLMKNVADINSQLLELHKKNRDFYEKRPSREVTLVPQQQSGDTHNYLFTGTTTDLQQQLTVMREADAMKVMKVIPNAHSDPKS